MADNDTPASSDTSAKKPAARRRSTTPAKAAAAKPRATKAKTEAATPAAVKTPAKARRTKRAATATRKAPARSTTTTAKTVTEKVGGKWGAAAIGAGVAAVGAAVAAAVLSTRRDKDAPFKATNAHQADGTDSSRSFEAGIADEGTIPGKS